MTDTTDSRARLEEFFRRRSDDPASVTVTEYEVITGGYSRAMARVWVEDATGRRGYVVRSDPPPGQSIIDTDRAQEWAVLWNGAIPEHVVPDGPLTPDGSVLVTITAAAPAPVAGAAA